MFRMMSGGTPLMVTATALFAFLSLLPLDARANDLEGDREGGRESRRPVSRDG